LRVRAQGPGGASSGPNEMALKRRRASLLLETRGYEDPVER
jgi:hypothetical protein